ncbi:phage tail tape measure protein [Virgibacillus dakarensis]|nr:phage tail tape measure protein [Virgibacillus dakarensis]MBT2215903.1 phage tail tape measure protein [Virgibacillus dakarensis]
MAKDVIADLVAQISLDGTQFQKGIGQVNRQLKTVQEELKTARSRFRQTGDSTDFLGNKSRTLSGKLKLQQERVKLLSRAYQESKQNSGEFSRNTQRLATQLERAKRELGETEHELKDVNNQLKTQKWVDYGKSVQNAGDKLQSIGRGMSNFGRSYTMHVTAPMVAGTGAIFKAAMDFESAWTGVTKTVDGSASEMANLKQSIRDMAKEIPASTTEIAAVAEAAGQLGIQTGSIEEFTRTMIDMGNSTNLTAQQAATEFARFANIVEMSQDDFDKLGSSTVALGNSMATTEQEISSMSLRLAAQGAQVGMSEAQILALAASMSSLGIEAEAGGTAMTTVLKKIDKAVGDGGDSLKGFAKAAGVSSNEFASAWEKDPITALDMFIKGLSKSGEEGENLSTILADLGIKGIRESDTILRLAGASDILSEAVNTSTKAWDENSALSEEAAKRYATNESQLKIMWNRIKDVAITLGDALAPAIMDTIDAAEPLIEKIESGAQAFADMDESQQRTILKMIALAAAIGPVSVVLGSLTSAVGGFMKVGGGLLSLLGKTGGKGLLGRFGLMGVVGGPVGIAIAGVSALSLVVGALKKDKEELQEVSLDAANAMLAEHETNEKMIDQFDKLRNKSKLTNDEFGRYIDLQSELESATNPDAIAAIKKEMEKLQEKSGLSNGELSTMVTLNGDIVESLPGATDKITDQGNKVAGTTDELRKYNQEIAQMATMELENEFTKALINQQELLKNRNKLEREHKESLTIQQELQNVLKDFSEESLQNARDRLKTEQEKLMQTILEKQQNGESIEQDQEKLQLNKEILDKLGGSRQEIYKAWQKQVEQTEEKQKQLSKTDEELVKLKQVFQQLSISYLKNAGISEEKARQVVQDGKSVQYLDRQIEKLQTQKQQLDDKLAKGEITKQQYRDQNGELDNQILSLLAAKGKISDLIVEAGRYTDELGQDVSKDVEVLPAPTIWDLNNDLEESVNKSLYVNPDPSISSINADLSNPINKVLSISRKVSGDPLYAEGTNFHPGGSFIAGEEGYELGRMGNRWEMLNFGAYDRPAGYQVFTHDESKKIIRALNNMPGYASGISPSGEADRVVSRLNDQQRVPVTGEAVIYTTVINQMDGREISRHTYKHTTEFQERDRKARESFA